MKKIIRKAVITAAGKGTRHYPATNAVQKELFPLVDRDGVTKPTIQLVVEEALAAGVEEICLVVQPGADAVFKEHFAGLAHRHSLPDKPWIQQQSALLESMHTRLSFVFQQSAEGFGHAVYSAAEWVGEEPFLLLLGDHVYLAPQPGWCSRRLLAVHEQSGQSVFGVQQTAGASLHLFGAVAGTPLLQNHPRVWRAAAVFEKPEITFAQQHCRTTGLADDRYLTFFGLYLFTPTIFAILRQHIRQNLRERGEIQLTTAQADLIQREGALAVEVDGLRLDMGTPRGYLETQLRLAMAGTLAAEISALIPPSPETGAAVS
ncbi:MAG TPA: sugar phosphate nucleotidyltransferase [bacterium]|nr:sugar phosphate nucleotidyltransferase [bacterium]